MNFPYICNKLKQNFMTTLLTSTTKVNNNNPIKVTRITEANIVCNESLKTSKRLAKAHTINM